MMATIRQAAGELLVVGFEGPEVTGIERAWLKLVRPAGVILFRRNINDPKQTRALLSDVGSLCAPHALYCVDIEGGTVDRLRNALAPMPSAQAVAEAARESGDTKLAQKQGELVARGVRAFGLNTTLAPVLDLALPDSTAVMGTRSASPNPDGVVSYARGFLAGLARHGVVGCGEHFPGLGGGMNDSHFETPAIHRGWRELWNEDLVPYQLLRDELPMVMVNHAAYPATPGKAKPASVSQFWISTVLRKGIRYRGIVLSDDLEMGGILKFMPMEEAVVSAVRAGMDLMEICHSPEMILRAYEALVSEGERSAAFRTRMLTRARETARKRANLFGAGTPPALTARQFETLRSDILRFREKIARATDDGEIVVPQLPKVAPVVETA